MPVCFGHFLKIFKHAMMRLLERHLVVKKSTLPHAGNGLFSRRAIKKGERIVEYRGRLERWSEVGHTDGYNPYLLRVNARLVINALTYRKAPGRYANDALGISRKKGVVNNGEYRLEGRRCFIYATRSIGKGDEILVSYGREFWNLIKRISSI